MEFPAVLGVFLIDSRILPSEGSDFSSSSVDCRRVPRLRGRTATQRSKKGSEKVLERVLGKGSQKGSEKGACYGFYSKKGF